MRGLVALFINFHICAIVYSSQSEANGRRWDHVPFAKLTSFSCGASAGFFIANESARIQLRSNFGLHRRILNMDTCESPGRMYSSVYLHPTSSGARFAFSEKADDVPTSCGFWRSDSLIRLFGNATAETCLEIITIPHILQRGSSCENRSHSPVHNLGKCRLSWWVYGLPWSIMQWAVVCRSLWH